MATSIQRLRAKAAAAGTLKTGKEQTVTTQTQGSETIIAIQPTDPEVVYVPTYDPNTAYGAVVQSELSADLLSPRWRALMSGLAWGVGIAAAGAMFSGWNWGYGGSGSYVNVNANRATNIDRNYNRANVGTGGRWQHDATIARASPTAIPQRVSNSDRTGRAPTSASSSAASSGEARRRSRRRRRSRWCRVALVASAVPVAPVVAGGRGRPGGAGGAGGPGGVGGAGGARRRRRSRWRRAARRRRQCRRRRRRRRRRWRKWPLRRRTVASR